MESVARGSVDVESEVGSKKKIPQLGSLFPASGADSSVEFLCKKWGNLRLIKRPSTPKMTRVFSAKKDFGEKNIWLRCLRKLKDGIERLQKIKALRLFAKRLTTVSTQGTHSPKNWALGHLKLF